MLLGRNFVSSINFVQGNCVTIEKLTVGSAFGLILFAPALGSVTWFCPPAGLEIRMISRSQDAVAGDIQMAIDSGHAMHWCWSTGVSNYCRHFQV